MLLDLSRINLLTMWRLTIIPNWMQPFVIALSSVKKKRSAQCWLHTAVMVWEVLTHRNISEHMVMAGSVHLCSSDAKKFER